MSNLTEQYRIVFEVYELVNDKMIPVVRSTRWTNSALDLEPKLESLELAARLDPKLAWPRIVSRHHIVETQSPRTKQEAAQ